MCPCFCVNFTFPMWVILSSTKYSLLPPPQLPTRQSDANCSSFCVDLVHHAVLLKKGDQHFGWAWRSGTRRARRAGRRGGTDSQQSRGTRAEAGPTQRPGWAHQNMLPGTSSGLQLRPQKGLWGMHALLLGLLFSQTSGQCFGNSLPKASLCMVLESLEKQRNPLAIVAAISWSCSQKFQIPPP